MPYTDPKTTTKSGLSYEYIIFKLLFQFKDKTPTEIERLLETLGDFDLLNDQGREIANIVRQNVWTEY
jgi:hypothetical protein